MLGDLPPHSVFSLPGFAMAGVPRKRLLIMASPASDRQGGALVGTGEKNIAHLFHVAHEYFL